MRNHPIRPACTISTGTAVLFSFLCSCDSNPASSNPAAPNSKTGTILALNSSQLHALCLDGGTAGGNVLDLVEDSANNLVSKEHAVVLECDSVWANQDTFLTYVGKANAAIKNLNGADCDFDLNLTSKTVTLDAQLNYRFSTLPSDGAAGVDTINPNICADYTDDSLIKSYNKTTFKGFTYLNPVTVTFDVQLDVDSTAQNIWGNSSKQTNHDSTQYVFTDGLYSIASWYQQASQNASFGKIINYPSKHFGSDQLVSFPVRFSDSLSFVSRSSPDSKNNCPENIHTLRWIECDAPYSHCVDENGKAISPDISYNQVFGESQLSSTFKTEEKDYYDSTNFRSQKIFVDVFDHWLTRFDVSDSSVQHISIHYNWGECKDTLLDTSQSCFYDENGDPYDCSTVDYWGCRYSSEDSAAYRTSDTTVSYQTVCTPTYLDSQVVDTNENNAGMLLGISVADSITDTGMGAYHVLICKKCVESIPNYDPYFLYDVMRHEVGHVLFQPIGSELPASNPKIFLYSSAHASNATHFMYRNSSHFDALSAIPDQSSWDSYNTFPYYNDESVPQYIDRMYLYYPKFKPTWGF
jgi:hypothetical protein